MNRPPSPAPALTGLRLVRHLGGGGFADVFLYWQESLRREVAVKVLLASASSPADRARFENEGAVMAALSEEHRNIVRVYDAAICADGRPYLVMQYCPNPDLAKRYQAGAFPVGEVLTIGVQLAGAVESAHRLGILHRDIKPANVLTTRQGYPALTDFGIAVTASEAGDPDSVGVSIPWSPPELLSAEPYGDARSDVYSLTATLYTLLAQRSPLEVAGRKLSGVDLLNRIPRIPAPPTGRGDTSPSLEGLLARGLAKQPGQRFASAEQLARGLQAVQREMGYPITDLDLVAADPVAQLAELAPDEADHTRVRPVVIRAQGVVGDSTGETHLRDITGAPVTPAPDTRGRPAPMPTPGPVSMPPDQTRMRGRFTPGDYLDSPPPAAPPVPDTFVPPRPAGPPAVPAKRGLLRPVPLMAAGVVVVIGGVLAWIVITGGTDIPGPGPTDPSTPVTTNLAIDDPAGGAVPAPTDLSGTVTSDGVVFTWANPEPQPDDTYHWTLTGPGTDGTARVTDAPTATVPGVQQACIEVVLVREDGKHSDDPAEGCAP